MVMIRVTGGDELKIFLNKQFLFFPFVSHFLFPESMSDVSKILYDVFYLSMWDETIVKDYH